MESKAVFFSWHSWMGGYDLRGSIKVSRIYGEPGWVRDRNDRLASLVYFTYLPDEPTYLFFLDEIVHLLSTSRTSQ